MTEALLYGVQRDWVEVCPNCESPVTDNVCEWGAQCTYCTWTGSWHETKEAPNEHP